MSTDYRDFLATKRTTVGEYGFDVALDALNPMLFPFQRHIGHWALRNLRAAETHIEQPTLLDVLEPVEAAS